MFIVTLFYGLNIPYIKYVILRISFQVCSTDVETKYSGSLFIRTALHSRRLTLLLAFQMLVFKC
jgi:hypothetical protein